MSGGGGRDQNAFAANNNGGGAPFETTFVHCEACEKSHVLPRKGLFQVLQKPPLPGSGGGSQRDNGSGTEVLCPLCQFQVLQVATGNGYEGGGYNVCPHCFGR